MTTGTRDEGACVVPSQAGDYTCPHCGDKLSYPPETYDVCPAIPYTVILGE